jgi:hypothetical protein
MQTENAVTGQNEVNLYPEDSGDRVRSVSNLRGDGAYLRFRFEPPASGIDRSVGNVDSEPLLETTHPDSR